MREFRMKSFSLLIAVSVLMSGPAVASSAGSWQALDQKSAKACISESGLSRARVGPATRFSDLTMIEARIVQGQYPQRHMRGAAAKMLCLYNRRSQRTEVQELR
jgi:hypothetical protein